MHASAPGAGSRDVQLLAFARRLVAARALMPGSIPGTGRAAGVRRKKRRGFERFFFFLKNLYLEYLRAFG
jgi:hypothetical protein